MRFQNSLNNCQCIKNHSRKLTLDTENEDCIICSTSNQHVQTNGEGCKQFELKKMWIILNQLEVFQNLLECSHPLATLPQKCYRKQEKRAYRYFNFPTHTHPMENVATLPLHSTQPLSTTKHTKHLRLCAFGTHGLHGNRTSPPSLQSQHHALGRPFKQPCAVGAAGAVAVAFAVSSRPTTSRRSLLAPLIETQ